MTEVVDRSAEQKRARVRKLRAELLGLGYSVITTAEWRDFVRGLWAKKITQTMERQA